MSVDNTIVTLDDGDPQLKWSGAWFTTAGIVDDLSNYGPPFLGTFHGISNNGSLVIPFYGTYTPHVCRCSSLNDPQGEL